jgi:hypothetical protein
MNFINCLVFVLFKSLESTRRMMLLCEEVSNIIFLYFDIAYWFHRHDFLGNIPMYDQLLVNRAK